MASKVGDSRGAGCSGRRPPRRPVAALAGAAVYVAAPYGRGSVPQASTSVVAPRPAAPALAPTRKIDARLIDARLSWRGPVGYSAWRAEDSSDVIADRAALALATA